MLAASPLHPVPMPFMPAPSFGAKSPSRALQLGPSPHHVLYITNQKIAKQVSHSSPDLRRLVLCANTYDSTVAYQDRLDRVTARASSCNRTTTTTANARATTTPSPLPASTVDVTDLLSYTKTDISSVEIAINADAGLLDLKDAAAAAALFPANATTVQCVELDDADDLVEDWEYAADSDSSSSDESEDDSGEGDMSLSDVSVSSEGEGCGEE